MEESTPRAGRSPEAPVGEIIDLPLVLYGLASGVLAVAAGALVGPALALPMVATVAVVTSLLGDALLNWLLPRPERSDPPPYP